MIVIIGLSLIVMWSLVDAAPPRAAPGAGQRARPPVQSVARHPVRGRSRRPFPTLQPGLRTRPRPRPGALPGQQLIDLVHADDKDIAFEFQLPVLRC